ncbi:Aste57867_25212 [Aphanomyces stellatus]|uniref:DDRGK domain-containing protein 1 n=1 Tax=Aphanomyces stellatus TaxID=120398 RepID=A0A485LUY0_9STRA|nr:hypothetical protein As57867_025134 [Aphanomyces stellatus]VFU01839.1 Aste57867_25212 [Aphanomyces stellatus]
MNTDLLLLVVAIVGLVLTMGTILYMVGYFQRRTSGPTAAEEDAEPHAGGGARIRNRGGLDGLRRRRRGENELVNAEVMVEERQAEDDLDEDAASDDDSGDDGGGTLFARAGTSRREMQKELKRQEREERRKFEESQREELKRQREAKDNAYRKKLDDDEAIETAKEEAAAAERLVKEKQEQADFDKWKTLFSVDEAGSDAALDESDSLVQDFVDYIETHKVVVLEDLAAAFRLPTQTAIRRLTSLVAANRLSGILDDRGKFISITEDEMDGVAKYICKRGRVSLADVARESNKLVRLPGH